MTAKLFLNKIFKQLAQVCWEYAVYRDILDKEFQYQMVIVHIGGGNTLIIYCIK
jgi:hypothetical protein